MNSNRTAADCCSVSELLVELDTYRDRIPLADLIFNVERTQVCFEDLQAWVRFHPDHYQRNLMHAGTSYQALVLCWRQGHRSPIHDHSGSSCVVKVVKGLATETLFQYAPNGMVFATRSRFLQEGSISASQDGDVHQVSNLQEGDADLVTLHVYSPPLLWMNVYSLLDGSISRFFDPINEDFVGGAGI